ncbi:unnamed protein product [Caenorhabditis bovis]|uniref:Saposin B-type domain-containing protein n=1 Tax=Caenorhabditis bovis TaxID=2654633 RepID=A0A8S1EI63_9PELO|nr:unnamed protein product [Caenorhabditis bovis]
MKYCSPWKLACLGLVLLIIRKIVIACMAMYIVMQHWDEVSFEKMIQNEMFQRSIARMSSTNPALILILNKHALNMTYNWLCNTQQLSGVHENTHIVTLDDEASEKLKIYWPTVPQINLKIDGLNDPFNYGDGHYQLFYLFRANLVRAFLLFNKPIWMVQQDTFWSDNLMNIDLKNNTNDDIIFDRASSKSPLIAGGYFLARPTYNSKRYFEKLAQDISWWYAPDNAYMTALCEVSGLAKCGRLPFHLITNWQWLENVSGTIPQFIQFDGETKLSGKLGKMKQIGFYFLSENIDHPICNFTSVENARSILNSKVSQWNKVASYSHGQFKMYQEIVDSFYMTRVGAAALNYFVLPYAHFCMLSLGVLRSGYEKWTTPNGNYVPPPPKYKMIRYAREVLNDPEHLSVSCFACTFAVDGVQMLLAQNSTDEEIANFLVNLCDMFNIEQPHVCKNIILAFKDEVVFVLERTVFTPREICGAFIHNCGHSEKPLTHMWNITIPGGKPPVRPWPKIPENKPTIKVLHLSDIHIDHQYAVGSEAYCQLDSALGTYAMCCRDYSKDGEGRPTQYKDKPIYVPSGPWGMPYLCDLPYQTFESAIKHISKTVKNIDYIIITGDFEAHDSWDYTEELTRENMNNMTNVFLEYFPNIPVYVSIGNHEGVPQDAMAPHTMPEYESRGPQWLYKIMADMWGHWIPQSALETVQYRASYAVYPKTGLKLISLNTIYCSEFNFYLYIDEVDPDATLEWLIKELLDSEKKGDVVHIISHIPPGDNYCLKGWSWNYFEIIKRFENIIAQMFYGHTHYDHFQVYYDMDDKNRRPFHFNWISPSLTTYAWLNPAYRVYEIDGGYEGATYNVKDAYTYFANVTEANLKNKEPEWKLEYNTRQFYNLTDLSPQSWSDLSDRLWANKTLFRQFVRYFYRNHYNNECHTDFKCHRRFVCDIKKGRSYDESFCDHLTK